MIDAYDDGREVSRKDRLTPLNVKKKPARQTAVALQDAAGPGDGPVITAAGRGVLAGKILQLAFDNGIKVREDGPLAEMLAKIEIDSPVPSAALTAVADILACVYRANGQPDPFNAVLADAQNPESQNVGKTAMNKDG